ncbi:MAG: ATP-binding protein [Tannerellaceae bacterium]|jgi:predicted ATPase|nr:ATP-binding protein [Tannerellaceae bacterium]
MQQIDIRNFGPITNGHVDINKVTVFVGNQAAGKSTAAKLISTFKWIEKTLVRGDCDRKWLERKNTNRLRTQFLPYHRLGPADTKKEDTYLKPDSVIDYQGDAYRIVYRDGSMLVTENKNRAYPLPQIMYVPAERNFLSYIKDAGEIRLSGALRDFNAEYGRAKNELKNMSLPINNIEVEYNKQYDNLYLRGGDYKIEINEAAGGLQSFVPLYLVSDYLAKSVKRQCESKETMSSEEKARFEKGVQDIWNNATLTDEQRTVAVSALSSKFNKAAFVNIVEEPEQNLFPSSQWQMLQSLLEFNNMNEGNKLILTTHSPYLINYLTIAIKAKQVLTDLRESNRETLSAAISRHISLNACINSDSVSIYELEEESGNINLLPKYKDLIPSDDNFLNNLLAEVNDRFTQLQEIEEENEN